VPLPTDPADSRDKHLDENIDAAWLSLNDADHEQVDAASRQLAGLTTEDAVRRR
jgi:hypothetical protein